MVHIQIYNLTQLIKFVLTLPISTAIIERVFSIMEIIMISSRNKMEDNFLNDCLTVYIEKKVVRKFSTNSFINEFSSMKECKTQFIFKKRGWNFKVC